MRKLVIGMVLAAFFAVAGSAQAATVFKKDNFTYKIKGDWQIQFRKDPGNDDQDMDIEYDDLEIKNYVAYKINDSLTAFGELDFGFKEAAEDSNSTNPDEDGADLEEAYLGIKFNDVKLMFGKTDSAADEFGVEEAIEKVGIAEDCFEGYGADNGDDLVKVEAKFADMVTVVASYEIAADSEKSDENGEFFDIFVSLDIQGFSVGAAFQNIEEYGSDEDFNIWGIQASYDAGFASFGVDYSATDAEDAWGPNTDIAVFNVAVTVPVEAFTFGGGYVLETYDDDDKDDINGWYLNATYKFPSAKNVSLFAEVGGKDEDDNDELGYLAGMRIKF